jgi:hypothetical protein
VFFFLFDTAARARMPEMAQPPAQVRWIRIRDPTMPSVKLGRQKDQERTSVPIASRGQMKIFIAGASGAIGQPMNFRPRRLEWLSH